MGYIDCQTIFKKNNSQKKNKNGNCGPKPTKITFFLSGLRLSGLMEVILRSVFSTKNNNINRYSIVTKKGKKNSNVKHPTVPGNHRKVGIWGCLF